MHACMHGAEDNPPAEDTPEDNPPEDDQMDDQQLRKSCLNHSRLYRTGAFLHQYRAEECVGLKSEPQNWLCPNCDDKVNTE